MQKVKDKAEFYKKMARFIELSIWFLLLALIFSTILLYNWYSHKNYSRYQIFLQDIDGIIVGSPVKMLGIQVGYVKRIKLVKDMVLVDFIINQKGIEIPKGSKITVEFSGLGGSRSLEVYAPKQKYESGMPQVNIQQPRRLGAAVSLLYQMFKKIGDIIYRCTYFSQSLEFDSLKNSNSKIDSNKEIQILIEADKWLDKQNSKK